MGSLRYVLTIVFLFAAVLFASLFLICLNFWQNAPADPELPFFTAFWGGLAGVALLAAAVARWG